MAVGLKFRAGALRCWGLSCEGKDASSRCVRKGCDLDQESVRHVVLIYCANALAIKKK
jgi:hypothetical protein